MTLRMITDIETKYSAHFKTVLRHFLLKRTSNRTAIIQCCITLCTYSKSVALPPSHHTQHL